ncbi:MAG: hypothetical protein CL726_11090 [Chloroflexi bacterium]|nr:hypothetical protein [Chloroflexota bacterium]|tara:strand:- start:312 stop:1097 length:786 start_codon:yes stop_codon:yes gene_type:complete
MEKMNDRKPKVTAGSQTVDRALSLLSCFSPARTSLPLHELSQLSGLTTSTTHRLLKTLESREFITFDSVSKLYSLGSATVRLASIVIQSSDIQTMVSPWLDHLRLLTGETAALHWLVEHHRVCVLEFESRHPIRMSSGTGAQYPLIRGAAGKALLAHFDPMVAEAVFSEAERIDAVSDLKWETLREELTAIREQGYATSYSEVVNGANAISAALLDSLGQPIAALNITGPDNRLDLKSLKRAITPLLEAVNDIRSRLGYSN